MKRVEELITLLKELEEKLISCMRCGMCQGVCPLYNETQLEPDVARGKIFLLKELIGNLLIDPKGIKKRLDRCLLCGSCEFACPSGVNLLEIFIKTRIAINSYLGFSTIERLIFKDIVSKPNIFNKIFTVSSRIQGLFLEEKNPLLNSHTIKIPIQPLRHRNIIPIKKVTFHKQYGGKNTSLHHKKLKVAIFSGCLVDKIFPEIGEDIIIILERLGIEIFVPKVQACCGIPLISNGDMEGFKKLVEKNISLYPPHLFDYIITPCATCTATIKKIWPMFEDKFLSKKDKIKIISQKCMDINEFLLNIVGLKLNYITKDKKKVTYHDPCHLKKSLNIYEEPRKLIKLNPELELEEMKKPDMCCGMGGTFNLKHYDISKNIGRKKVEDIIATKANIVATSCPACMLQIIDVLSDYKVNILVKHPIQLIADAIRKGGEIHGYNRDI